MFFEIQSINLLHNHKKIEKKNCKKYDILLYSR